MRLHGIRQWARHRCVNTIHLRRPRVGRAELMWPPTRWPRAGAHRGLPPPPSGAAYRMVGPPPPRVSPVQRRPVPPRPRANGRVLVLQPAAPRLGVLLERPAYRLLGREASSRQSAAYRPDRQPHPQPPLDQLRDGVACPHGKRQCPLLGAPVDRPPWPSAPPARAAAPPVGRPFGLAFSAGTPPARSARTQRPPA